LARKRKRIYELIGNVFNENKMEDKDYLDLYQGLCFINNINLILLKSNEQEKLESGELSNTGFKGEIYFSSDPSMWKRDTPVWIADYRSRWVAVQTENSSQNIKNILAEWISNSEQSGWFIEWPDVDMSKEELVNNLSKFPTWSETDKKLKKDILSKRFGKARCIKLFTEWNIKFDSDFEH
jgi:hypothetical protein